MDGHRLFRKDQLGDQGGELIEHLSLTFGTGEEPVQSLQEKIRGQTDTVACFCYRPPLCTGETEEDFFRNLEEAS